MMRVSQFIIEKLLNDKEFRLKTAAALLVSENNIRKLAKNNSDNLTKMAAIEFFRSTGLTDDQIFEHQTAES